MLVAVRDEIAYVARACRNQEQRDRSTHDEVYVAVGALAAERERAVYLVLALFSYVAVNVPSATSCTSRRFRPHT